MSDIRHRKTNKPCYICRSGLKGGRASGKGGKKGYQDAEYDQKYDTTCLFDNGTQDFMC